MFARFTHSELLRLSVVLDIPSPFKTHSGHAASALEALALLCAHLRCEGSQWTLVTRYARSQSAISEIIGELIEYIDRRWKFLLEWDAGGLVHPRRLQEYAQTLRDFGAPCDTVFGFIDCTIRSTCRPIRSQELVYTGYKKRHGMKFQAVTIPNGLIAHLSGPYRAPQNDSGVLNESKLLDTLRQHAIQPGSYPGDPAHLRYFQVYGDSAYGLGPSVLSPFSEGREHLTAEQQAWNTAMGGVRISVEHAFCQVAKQWPQLNCYWRQRIWGTRCGLLYRVAVLLTNAKACLDPNQTSQRYDCLPPCVEDYFHAN